eukprot:8705865-Pyramimonas_sp.AAC.1
MKSFYSMRRLNNRKQITVIKKLKWQQLSPDAEHPRLKAKAAQTRNLLPLVQLLCEEYPTFLGPNGAALLRAAKHLNEAHT